MNPQTINSWNPYLVIFKKTRNKFVSQSPEHIKASIQPFPQSNDQLNPQMNTNHL